MYRPIQIHDHEGERRIALYDPKPVEDQALFAVFNEMMTGAQTIHTADPINRGISLAGRTLFFGLILAGFTVPVLWMFDALYGMLWLFFAMLEFAFVFLYLSYKDWQEHPSSLRWRMTEGLLWMMERSQDARFIQAGIDPNELSVSRPASRFLDEFTPTPTRERARTMLYFFLILTFGFFVIWYASQL